MSPIVRPASATRRVPFSTLPTLSPINTLISLAAVAERCASERTSLATTAKPRPCSPARAASTAAFSARMLVWNAMPSITPMMSVILFELSVMPFIVATTCPTTSPPRAATVDAPSASSLARRAVSALSLTVAVSSSIDAAVCCRLLACSSVRWLRSALPLAICDEPMAMDSEALRTSPTMATRLSFMCLSAPSRVPISSWRSTTMVEPRSPAATVLATFTATAMPPVMERMRLRLTSAATASTTPLMASVDHSTSV